MGSSTIIAVAVLIRIAAGATFSFYADPECSGDANFVFTGLDSTGCIPIPTASECYILDNTGSSCDIFIWGNNNCLNGPNTPNGFAGQTTTTAVIAETDITGGILSFALDCPSTTGGMSFIPPGVPGTIITIGSETPGASPGTVIAGPAGSQKRAVYKRADLQSTLTAGLLFGASKDNNLELLQCTSSPTLAGGTNVFSTAELPLLDVITAIGNTIPIGTQFEQFTPQTFRLTTESQGQFDLTVSLDGQPEFTLTEQFQAVLEAAAASMLRFGQTSKQRATSVSAVFTRKVQVATTIGITMIISVV